MHSIKLNLMEITLTFIQTLLFFLFGIVAVKAYFTYESAKAQSAEDGRIKRAEIYAKGKEREARIEFNAGSDGFNDAGQGMDGIEGLLSQFITTPEGMELIKGFLSGEKKT